MGGHVCGPTLAEIACDRKGKSGVRNGSWEQLIFRLVHQFQLWHHTNSNQLQETVPLEYVDKQIPDNS